MAALFSCHLDYYKPWDRLRDRASALQCPQPLAFLAGFFVALASRVAAAGSVCPTRTRLHRHPLALLFEFHAELSSRQSAPFQCGMPASRNAQLGGTNGDVRAECWLAIHGQLSSGVPLGDVFLGVTFYQLHSSN